ncbi:MAG: ATP-binding protein [Thermodesulfobacteriota bacterium]
MYEFIRSRYFQNLIEGFSSGVIIINSAGIVYVYNDSAATILGVPPDDALKHPWTDLAGTMENRGQLAALIDEIIHDSRSRGQMETRLHRNDGTTRYLTVSAARLTYFNQLFGISLEISDVTSIYRLHQSEKRLLLERSEGLKRFAMAVAHQIRNPLAVIGGLVARICRKKPTDCQSSEYHRTIRDCIGRLERVVDSTFHYTRISKGREEKVNLGPFLRGIQKELAAGLPENGPQIAWEVELEDIALAVDPTLMREAMEALLRNAVEACASGQGRISVRGARQENSYQITISDTGTGIGDSDLPYIFDPFFSTKPSHIGMGLCTVKRIMEEHDGKVSVENTPDQEVTVQLLLPLDRE